MLSFLLKLFVTIVVTVVVLPVLYILFGFRPQVRDSSRAPKKPHRESFKPSKIPQNPDAIVIGSGMGGMACASFLAQLGKRVLVLEQHERLGGCTHTFELNKRPDNRDEHGDEFVKCEFDTGTHYVSLNTGLPFQRAGAAMSFITGGQVKFTDLGDVWDSVLFPTDAGIDEHTYQFRKGFENQIEMLLEFVPEEKKKIVRERVQAMMTFFYTAQHSIIKLYIVKALPNFIQSFFSAWVDTFHQYGRLSTAYVMNAMLDCGYTAEDVLAKRPLLPGFTEELSAENLAHSPDPELTEIWRRVKGILVHPIGDYACQPSDSSVIAHSLTAWYYVNGASYTVGPTQNISIEAAKIVWGAGGACLVNALVEQILIENGRCVGVRVRRAGMAKKEPVEIRCDTVVCGAGLQNLYRNLLPQEMPIVQRFKQLSRFIPSFGHNFLFVCLKGDPEEIDLPRTNGWYLNGYDTDDRFNEYFADPTGVTPPTVYLGFPCTKDVTWSERYKGVSNCILISDAKWEWFTEWEDTYKHGKRAPNYEQMKAEFTEKLLEVLYAKVPNTRGRVLWCELGTPLSDHNFLMSYQGGSYGTRCNTDYFSRESSRWLMRGDTEVPGLYLAGEDAFCPAVAGAMYGGILGAVKVVGFARAITVLGAIVTNMADLIQKKEKVGRLEAYKVALGNIFR